MKERVLVLGGNGFIGRKLKSTLEDCYEIIEFNRSSHSLIEKISNSFPSIVINCSASQPNAKTLESFDANISFQM